MSEVLDYYAVQSRATLQCFKDGGAAGIAHYLTASMSDPREINRQELEDSRAVGLAVHLVFEMNPTYPEYFTFAQGAVDCRTAQDRLADLGAPDGTVVYFTVDVNIDPNLIVEYFNGVESVVTPRIVPGLYGFQRACEFAYEIVGGQHRFPNVSKHLWQTYGIATVPLDLWQHFQVNRCGVEVDVNEASAPGWKEEDTMTAPELIAAIKADPALAQAVYDAIAPIIQDRVVAPEVSTDIAEKAVEARLDATVQQIQDNITKLQAAPTGSLADQHIAAVALATLRGVFDGVTGDMPKPPFVQ